MTIYFGLNVTRNLTEVPDGRAALLSLGLDTRDLESIKGLSDPYGVVRSDFRTLSGLTFDLEKVAASLRAETDTYESLTTNFYDQSSVIQSNLNINGQLAASSIKYLYVDFTTNTVKAADISTSRVSSWSSFDVNPTLASPIFYGGEVTVTTGNIELSQLNIRDTIIAKRFDSEIPTHKIKTVIDGEIVNLYAMKGIPLIFTGYFRTAALSITKNSIFPLPNVFPNPTNNGFRPSWVITNVSDGKEFVYANVALSGNNSNVSFSDTTAKERTISIYYPPSGITALSLTSISLVELPNVNLPNLQTLSIQNNDIREFPDLSGYTSLITLDISNNNLTRATTSDLSSFGAAVVARIPLTIRTLNIGNCFNGAYTADLSSLTNLINLRIISSVGARRLQGTSPKVPATIQIYDIRGNQFSTIDDSVKTSLTLTQLYIDYNLIVDSTITIASPELTAFTSYYDNRHNLVDVAGKTKLVTYAHYSVGIVGASDVTNVFTGCTALQNITVMFSAVTGSIPSFSGCIALKTVDFYSTTIGDASPGTGADVGYVLADDTFNSCRSTLTFFRIYSPNIGFHMNGATKVYSQFSNDCFKFMKALSFLYISSQKRGINGVLPSFATAVNLQTVYIFSNYLSGQIPNFSNCIKLNYLYLNDNAFTGPVPNITTSLSFQYLYASYNQLSSFNKIDSTNLKVLYLSYNRIPSIPDMSNLTRLQEFSLNNQQGVGRVSYTKGSFNGLIAIRTLDISNNNISQSNINQIIKDLNINYNTLPRGNVTINLRGNAAPSTATGAAVSTPEDDIPAILAKLRLAGWTVLTN